MSEIERQPTAAELVEELGEVDVNGTSLRDRLAKRRQDVAANRTTDIDIPGYDGELFCRYQLLDPHRLNSIVERVTRQTRDRVQRGLWANMDTLIAACQEFWVRDNGREIRLAELVNSDVPVRYDEQLAEFLMFSEEVSSQSPARSVVMKVFMDNELAIARHAQILSRWMTDNERDATDELLGEA